MSVADSFLQQERIVDLNRRKNGKMANAAIAIFALDVVPPENLIRDDARVDVW